MQQNVKWFTRIRDERAIILAPDSRSTMKIAFLAFNVPPFSHQLAHCVLVSIPPTLSNPAMPTKQHFVDLTPCSESSRGLGVHVRLPCACYYLAANHRNMVSWIGSSFERIYQSPQAIPSKTVGLWIHLCLVIVAIISRYRRDNPWCGSEGLRLRRLSGTNPMGYCHRQQLFL